MARHGVEDPGPVGDEDVGSGGVARHAQVPRDGGGRGEHE